MIPHRLLARACERSYRVHSHEAGDAQALLEIHDGEAVFAVRGTEFDFGDIITDLRAFPWWASDLQALCHSGFLKSARSLYAGAVSDLAAVAKEHPLNLAGHSLGAAQATVVACYLVSRGAVSPDRLTLTGFGSPAPQYGSGLNKWLQGIPITLYKNGSDAVPSHPVFGSHVRELTLIGPEDTLRRSLSDKRYLDHRIRRYIAFV